MRNEEYFGSFKKKEKNIITILGYTYGFLMTFLILLLKKEEEKKTKKM